MSASRLWIVEDGPLLMLSELLVGLGFVLPLVSLFLLLLPVTRLLLVRLFSMPLRQLVLPILLHA